jgi:MoxR-like ATPase
VRGAIDLVLIGGRLAELTSRPATDDDVGLDAALTALGGRIRVHEGADADPEQIIRDLWAAACRDVDAPPEDGSGKA